jgi:phenylpropionate dioxygenase-like ring-hydroxylating dioxygenase large terminal subunit
VRWRAHWTRVMENMLDMPHLPFVHRKTIGRSLAPLVGGRMDVRWDGRPYGAHITHLVDGAPRAGALDYRFPNAMELFIDPPGRVLRLMAICVPEDEATTRLVLLTFRSFLKVRAFDGLFYWMNSRIAREDKDIVESSLPLQAPAPGEEASVRTDEPTLAFRRIWWSQLRQSSAPTPDR